MSQFFPLFRFHLRVLFRSFWTGRRQTSQSGSPLLWDNQSLYSCITMTTISSISNNLAGCHFLMPYLRYQHQPVRMDARPALATPTSEWMACPCYPQWPVSVGNIPMLLQPTSLDRPTNHHYQLAVLRLKNWIQTMDGLMKTPILSPLSAFTTVHDVNRLCYFL